MEIKPFDNYQKTKSDCESIRITEEIKKKKSHYMRVQGALAGLQLKKSSKST